MSLVDQAQRRDFAEHGWLTLPGFLAPDHCDRLARDVDAWVAGGVDDPYAPPELPRGERTQLAMPEAGMLVSHPPLMEVVEALLGPGFAYHHIHLTRFDAGAQGIGWHHDYMQFPQTNRSHGMVHAFCYLRGLNGTIGDLLLLPGSHRWVVAGDALFRFGTDDLPGSLTIDRLPPGSVVVVHSALLHGRRAKPGGEGTPRYFIDVSYCQAGISWPSDYGDWRAKLAVARARGLDRGGRYAHLFDETSFFDVAEARRRAAALQGSLITS